MRALDAASGRLTRLLKSEERFKAIGKSDDGRYIFAVFTLRTRGGKRLVRLISARFMHKREVEHYEKQTAKLQKR